MTDDSYVQVSSGGTTFAGRDGVSLFQATTLKVGLGMYARTGVLPNRAWTPSAMLAAAGRITQKTYKRGQHAQAAADLEQWIAAMRAALPVIDEKGKAI